MLYTGYWNEQKHKKRELTRLPFFVGDGRDLDLSQRASQSTCSILQLSPITTASGYYASQLLICVVRQMLIVLTKHSQVPLWLTSIKLNIDAPADDAFVNVLPLIGSHVEDIPRRAISDESF